MSPARQIASQLRWGVAIAATLAVAMLIGHATPVTAPTAEATPMAPTVGPTATEAPVSPPREGAPPSGPSARLKRVTKPELLAVGPWTAQGLHPEAAVRDEVVGWCGTGSIIVARTDAWRCVVEGGRSIEFHDPCLVNPFDPDGPLACVDQDGAIVVLMPTEPLPHAFANLEGSERLPLKVVLADGDECSLNANSTASVDGRRVSYSCSSGGVLVGGPDKSAGTWTIDYSPRDNSGDARELTTVFIHRAVAFRGDTATIGSGPTGRPRGVVTEVTSQSMPDRQRVIFAFDGDDHPAYHVGYAAHTRAPDDGDEDVAVDAAYTLRISLSGVRHAGDLPPRVPASPDLNQKEILLVPGTEGDSVWHIGLEEIRGFQVTVLADPTRLAVDIFAPVPGASDRPVLVIGDRGQPVYALQERLIGGGYLDSLPEAFEYDEDTRRAVIAFQQDHGMVPDGVVRPETWAPLDRPIPPRPEPDPAPPDATPAPQKPSLYNSYGRPIAYLTFDDGPSRLATEEILDLLARFDARATFFALGQQVRQEPELARAVVAGGHSLQNHTFSHQELDSVTGELFASEVDTTQWIIQHATGVVPVCLRPPSGLANYETHALAWERRLRIVKWDIDPKDWRRPGADAIASHVVEQMHPGAIVLLHDGGGERSQTIAALEVILGTLGRQGYAFEVVCP